MRKISKQEMDRIMEGWLSFAKQSGLDDDHTAEYLHAEKAYIYGSFTAILMVPPEKVQIEQIPPAVAMAMMSGRPVSSLGNWGPQSSDERLKTASHTLPRGGGLQWA